jgi:CDP-diacylglycerol--glycerol-3-phosphate 3-phosphatidyltransferase
VAENQTQPHDVDPIDANGQTSRWLTLPNLITALRILGSPILVVFALAGQTVWLAVLAVFLVFTEWLDGFLARRLHVTSAIGARLDTVADAIFYSALLAAVVLLNPERIRHETIWIAAAVTSYLCSWLASWVKFQRLPSYHTWAAKGVWVIVGTGIVCLLAGISPWPFRAAMVCVALTNLEATLITFQLSRCQVDVPSLWHARRADGDQTPP